MALFPGATAAGSGLFSLDCLWVDQACATLSAPAIQVFNTLLLNGGSRL